MEKHDLVLNLHGEVPSGPGSDITDLTAEEAFLPTLIELNQRFPKLRIVLEHCSTAAAIAAVRACSPSVAGELASQSQSIVVPFFPFFFEMKIPLSLMLNSSEASRSDMFLSLCIKNVKGIKVPISEQFNY